LVLVNSISEVVLILLSMVLSGVVLNATIRFFRYGWEPFWTALRTKGKILTTSPDRTVHDVDIFSINRWKKNAVYVGIILPDGWYGEPYKHMLTITHFHLGPVNTILEFDHLIVIVIHQAQRVQVIGDELVFGEFDSLSFLPHGFNETPRKETYDSGELRIMELVSKPLTF
jgi:hypothetical protein